ncbi:MAG: aminotransferase class I/II-fold pyridoxal phosphate-dependent enzyme, partial [Gemmatimonadales bacterium]
VLEAGTMPEIFHGLRGPDQGGCYLYGRHFNPTVYTLASQLAAIEGTEAAYCSASGMSAISAALIQCCAPGDHIVAGNTLYGGTFALLQQFFHARTGVSTTFVDIRDLTAVERAFTPKTRVLYVETLANPTLVVADIPELAAIAHRHGARLIVDNTFTPLVIAPARHGADVVVHSMTKFLSGASDIIAGCICASKEFITSLMDVSGGALMLLGPTMDPRVAFDLSLRIPHLGLRMQEHGRRAQLFAERLHQRGLKVTYPGLPSHPQHALFNSIASLEFGSGGVFGLDVGTAERASQLLERLQNEEGFGWIAVSLGYFDTLLSVSASSTSSEMPEADQTSAGLSPGLVRVSLGYTGTLEQRWGQMERALAASGL